MTLDRVGAGPVHGLARAISAGAAIEAALETGVLDALAAAPATAAELAARAGTDPHATALLLAGLVDAGAAKVDLDGRTAVTVDPDALRTVLQPWAGLASFVRSGRRDLALGSGDYRALTPALADLDTRVLDAVAGAVGDPGRLLDVGAGAAPWTRALLAAHPSATAVLVDVPAVAPVTAVAVEGDGLGDRCTVVAGDAFHLDVEGSFDTVLVAGFCRLFAEDDVRRLLRDLAARTVPGGRIVLVDALPDGDRADAGSVGLYALGLALRSAGAVHPFSAYAAWLFDAGFVRIEAEPLGVPELSLIRAVRPT